VLLSSVIRRFSAAAESELFDELKTAKMGSAVEMAPDWGNGLFPTRAYRHRTGVSHPWGHWSQGEPARLIGSTEGEL